MTVTLVKPHIVATDAGVWLSGANHGWRIAARAVWIAVALGMTLSDTDRAYVECFEAEHECAAMLRDGTCDCPECVDEISREAEQWLTERAPDGYTFGFRDGDFGMWRSCPITGEWDDECIDRHCELHYMSAPLRFQF